MEEENHPDGSDAFFLGPPKNPYNWRDFEAAKREISNKNTDADLVSLSENSKKTEDHRNELRSRLRPKPPTVGLMVDNVDNDNESDCDYNPVEDMRTLRARAAEKAKRTKERRAREREVTADEEQKDTNDEEDKEEENSNPVSPSHTIPTYPSDHESGGTLGLDSPADSDHSSSKTDLPKLGDPAVRGCIPCFKATENCTLISTPSVYPCQHCKSHSSPCRLFNQPARKAPCISCTSQNNACLFLQTNGVDAASCTNCSSRNVECFAGPLGSIPAVMQLRGEQKRTGSKHLKPCQACRRAKEVCSLTLNREEKMPCSKCRRIGEQCTFDKVRMKRATKGKKAGAKRARGKGKAKKKTKAKSKSKKLRRRRDKSEKPPSNIADNPTIKTAFSHPIIFDHSSTPDDPCSFCSTPSYALHGLGAERTVEIDPDSLNIEEISDGYRARGIPQTRLCNSCTLLRLMIIFCDKHELRGIPGYVPMARNLWEQLADDVCEEIPVPAGVRICSLCVEEGVVECCTKQEEGDDPEVEVKGCGLVLCRVCEGRWKCFKGLNEMIEEAREDKVNYPDGSLRADVGLLTDTGELMMFTREFTGGSEEIHQGKKEKKSFGGQEDVDITGLSIGGGGSHDNDDEDDVDLDLELSLD